MHCVFIQEFNEIIKKGQLLPLNDYKEESSALEGAEKNMFDATRFFPLAYSKTILFNMSKPISPLIPMYLQVPCFLYNVVYVF